MSMFQYIQKKYPKDQIRRSENIYEESKTPHFVEKWKEWHCIVIIRNPIDRIHSCHQYFTELRQRSVQDILAGKFPSPKNYFNIGAKNLIQQSDYDYYIRKFEQKHQTKITIYKFEDLINDPDFPHINETLKEYQRKWDQKEIDYVQDALDKAGIVY